MADKRRLETLFRQHYRQMYTLAVQMLHDEAESKDVVHDIFVQLLDGRHDLREDTAETYLLTSVRNRCLNVIRDRETQERVARLYQIDADAESGAVPTELGSQDPLLLEEELTALSEGIDRLDSPVDRDIILQHFRDGLTFREIARGLGVSETTVYKHLRRALNQLRSHLLVASFISLLFVSTIALAVIHIVRQNHGRQSEEPKPATDTVAVANTPIPTMPSSPKIAPRLYDNVPLEQMLAELSVHYGVSVAYRDEAVRQLRLHYKWKPEYTLAKVVEMLNHFESLHLELDGDTLYVSSTIDARP